MKAAHSESNRPRADLDYQQQGQDVDELATEGERETSGDGREAQRAWTGKALGSRWML